MSLLRATRIYSTLPHMPFTIHFNIILHPIPSLPRGLFPTGLLT
jgi:hypothetical protein